VSEKVQFSSEIQRCVYFSDYILKIGNGEEDIFTELGENAIQIPEQYLVDTLEDLIDTTFPELDLGCENITDCCIYTPLNKDVRIINDVCIEKFPGNIKTYLSADSILEDDHKEAVPVEYLNVMNPSGISDHQLSLKTGAPIMLLRNLQAGPNVSLRNGTRMVVVQMMERALEVEVAVGINKGLRLFLPRVPQYDKSGDYPFTLVRRQFPIRYSYLFSFKYTFLIYILAGWHFLSQLTRARDKKMRGLD
jgi:ATP-dependent DNA helicase PIF1